MAVGETATVILVAKAGFIAGIIGGALSYIYDAGMAPYLIGMIFAYIYAMNHREFKVNIKEDISVVVIGMTLAYFIAKITPKIVGNVDAIENMKIVNETSNIIGVIIGTVLLLAVKYWLTIRQEVVKRKLDWITANKRHEKGGFDDDYDDEYIPRTNTREDKDDD